MAQSRVTAVEPALTECDEDGAVCDCLHHENVRRAEASHELSHEDIFEELTAWLRAKTTRTQQIEVLAYGLVCKLHESGQLQATGRGRHADEAIINALGDLP